MKKINFDIKYKPEIISGKYKVIFRNNREANILSWDVKGERPLCVIDANSDEPKPELYYNTGLAHIADFDCEDDLFILTDDEEGDELYKATLKDISNMLDQHFFEKYTMASSIDQLIYLLQDIRSLCNTTLSLGEKLERRIDKNSETYKKAYSAGRHCGFIIGSRTVQKKNKNT